MRSIVAGSVAAVAALTLPANLGILPSPGALHAELLASTSPAVYAAVEIDLAPPPSYADLLVQVTGSVGESERPGLSGRIGVPVTAFAPDPVPGGPKGTRQLMAYAPDGRLSPAVAAPLITTPPVASSLITTTPPGAAPVVVPSPIVALATAPVPGVADRPSFDVGGIWGGPIDAPPAQPLLATPNSAAVAALKTALVHLRKGEAAEAAAVAEKSGDPVLASLVDWLNLRALRLPAFHGRLSRFADAHPHWPGMPMMRKRIEASLLQERANAAALIHFSRNDPTSGFGRIALARALDPRQESARVADLVREAWRKEDFNAAFEAQVAAEFAQYLRVEDHRFRMERFLLRERFGDALRAAERAGKDYVTLVKARQAVVDKAANAKALIDAVPKTLHGDSSYLYSLARHHRRKDEAKEAAAVLQRLPASGATLADGDEWWVERRMIARKLLDIGEPKLAYEVARDHVAETPINRIEAEFHAGWIALRFLKDPALARTHFETAADIAESPISTARAAYWRGRAAEELGEQDVATGHYRDAARESVSYYGQLALGRLGGIAPPSVNLRGAPPADNPGAAAIAHALALLYAAGERPSAMRLLADAGQELDDVALLRRLGDIALAAGDARAVLTLGKLAIRRNLPLVEHAFPLAGIPEFKPVAEAVDKAMVYAIARQESAFDIAAVSHAGARGLMQLMPATAKRTADRFKVAFALPRLTTDGAYNAQIGAAHLRELMEEWNGSLILVFAAYNAGGHNVSKWIKAYGDPRDPAVDPVDWIERIPFTETRNYVQRVLENFQVYRVRLGARDTVALDTEMRLGMKREKVADGQ